MSRVKISWSGGKDSTASCILHLYHGDYCIIVCYVPMLNDTIPLIKKSHYDFICSAARKFLEIGECEVHILTGITFEEHAHHIVTRGINKGRPMGARLCAGLKPGWCAFKRDSKLKALDGFKCVFDYEDVGIAADETRRLKILTEKKRSILAERGLSEHDAFRICRDNNLLSPIYDSVSRDGCAICPFAKKGELADWSREWPGAFDALVEIEKYCKEMRPEIKPLPGNLWWSDILEGKYV